MFKNNQKNFALGLGILASSALGLVSVPANAASPATTHFTVNATVPAMCTVAASNLSFGNYTGTAPVNKTSTITTTCTSGTTYTIALSTGNGGSFAPRTMQQTAPSTTGTLNYNLYTTSADAKVWGDGTTSGTVTQGATTGISGISTPTAYTVYGNIPAGQNPPIGTYQDTINVTVTY